MKPERSIQVKFAWLAHLTFTILRANSADDKLMTFFLYFPQNRIRHFMHIGDILYKMSNPIFWKKKKKYGKYFNKYLLKILPKVISVNMQLAGSGDDVFVFWPSFSYLSFKDKWKSPFLQHSHPCYWVEIVNYSTQLPALTSKVCCFVLYLNPCPAE